MSPQDLAEVRKAPLFATLQESQSGCLEPGEIIELPQGAVLAPEGEVTGYFYVLLEGEIRITRTYDKQTILMAVSKPGSHLGEIMLLLGVPWLSTARISKAARLFQLDEDGFWNMLATCHTVARELFRTATN